MGHANAGALLLALRNPAARAREVDVEVHTVDTSRRVVLEPEVNVLRDTEAERAALAEVLLLQFVLEHLEPTLEDLLRLLAAHGHVARDLLVAAHMPLTDGQASLRVDRLLVRKLLQHACRARQAITRFTNRDVQDELLDADLPHRVLLRLRHGDRASKDGKHSLS